MTIHPHQMKRDFDDPELIGALLDDDMPFGDATDLGTAEPVAEANPLPTFPARQREIARYCGLSDGTISEKMAALAKLHKDVKVFTDYHGEKRVTLEGFQVLQELIRAGNIKAYRIQVAERKEAEARAAAATVEPTPIPPQFVHPATPISPAGTPHPIAQIPQLGLVPTHGTPAPYGDPLGLPIAPATQLSYYQPTVLAQSGAGAVGLAGQLMAAITASLETTYTQTAEDLQATRSQRAALQAQIPEIQARVAALRAANIQASVALDHEKKLLAQEARQLQDLAAQAGYSVPGLDGLF